MTDSGSPANCLRSSGSWVATPTEQVFRWHLRSMMQPITTSAAVATPHSSAPSSVAIATSRPVFIWPSVWTTIRPRRPFWTRTCCVSATPSSQGRPECLIEDSGDEPVPPESPEIKTTSPCPFDTPAAMIPTPTSETSFTWIRASGFTFLRS